MIPVICVKELSLSVNTIDTHLRHLYTKLGGHPAERLSSASARGVGLLAASWRRR